ncbi:unnamed protein product [Phytomonas sp. Hart1]|nr:unnamed protein product [Phytomonas sp. Hart1]|eukprot:CCW69209.1 unnamed protein product [Phytomonas sp. isolate Hart1]
MSFEPFRVVGSICGSVPISCTMLYGTPVLMVATGRTFNLFKGKELVMIRGGPILQEPLRAVAQCGKYYFAAEGPRVHAWAHHKLLWTTLHQELTCPSVVHLLAQDDLLFCLGDDKRIAVRAIKTGSLIQEISVGDNEDATIMALLMGYTNKLLVATAQGSLHIYNYKTAMRVWCTRAEASHHGTHAPILCLACSSHKDIIAYGTSDGKVIVFNVGTGETITTFRHKQGAITALAFRVDKDYLLMAGSSLGEIIIWDLGNRCMDGALTRSKQVRSDIEVLETPHLAAVHSLIVFPKSEDMMFVVTGGADNAIMEFRFDSVDGLGLLVRERRGHMGGCTTAAFYNKDLLITAGHDRSVRVTHLFSDRASWELSQGKLGKRGQERHVGREALKMTPAISIASCSVRNYQWASAVTLHQDSAQMCGWRMDTRALEFKLSGIKTVAHTARVVTMSNCGSFAVVGYSSGNAVVINIQNRSLRQLFDPAIDGNRSHANSVECIEVACSNTIIITAGLDGFFKLWSLANGELKQSVSTGKAMTKSCIHQDSSLFIVAQHYTISVYHCNPEFVLDQAALHIPVRELVGHRNPITAMVLAPDSFRYVVSASGDAVLLVWDLAAAACVGQYRLSSPAISISFHPDALFLSTTHVGECGTFLWVNNLRYGYVPEVILNPSERELHELPWMHFPITRDPNEHYLHDGYDELTHSKKVEENQHKINEMASSWARTKLYDVSTDVALIQRQANHKVWETLDHIQTKGLRLSGVPRRLWYNITMLDQIKEKNNPLIPPKKKDVPFFLPTVQELRPTFILVVSNNNRSINVGASTNNELKPQLVKAGINSLNEVQEMLVHREFNKLMNCFLRKNATQAIDIDIHRVIDFVGGVDYGSEELNIMEKCLRSLLNFLTMWIRRGENVELIQGILANALCSHATVLTQFSKELASDMLDLTEAQNKLRYNIGHIVSYPSCLAGAFTGSFF